MDVLYIQNDNIVELDELRDVDGVYINSATVSITSMVDAAGNAVTGLSLPLTMTYVAASNGRYRATIQETGIFLPGQKYKARITADGGGLNSKFALNFLALERLAE